MNKFDIPELIIAHKESSYHRDALRDSELCGCFYCQDVFDYKNINDWCDNENTALCPSCGVDSVIGSASGFPMTQEFLKAMQAYYFNLSAK